MVDLCIPDISTGRDLYYWDYVVSHWEINDVYMIAPAGTPIDSTAQIGSATVIQTADELPSKPIVVLSPTTGRYIQGIEDLIGFVHPADCVYVFGSDHAHLSSDDMGDRVADSLVYIATQSEAKEMHSFVAAAVTLYDRAMKNG